MDFTTQVTGSGNQVKTIVTIPNPTAPIKGISKYVGASFGATNNTIDDNSFWLAGEHSPKHVGEVLNSIPSRPPEVRN